jgi:hypothetical protein
MAQGTTKGVPIDTDPLLAADSDLLVPSQKAVKSYAQPQLNGLGFVKASGTTISYDNSTYLTSVGTGVTNELTYWSGTNAIGSLTTATYPSLTELSYVKGVTSSIQTQLGTKATDSLVVHLAGAETITGVKTFTPSFAASSGTTATNSLIVSPTINNTGTYSGIARGLYYAPTLTSITGTTHRAWENTTGDVYLCSTSGQVGIGNAPNATYKLDVGGTLRTTGAITATSSGHRFGNFEILTSGNAGTTGQGITVTGVDTTIQFQGSSQTTATDMFQFRSYGGISTTAPLTSTSYSVMRVYGGFGNPNINSLSGNTLWLSPTYNITDAARSGTIVRGIYYAPTLTSLTNTTHTAFENTTGNVLLGTTSGVTRVANSTIAWQGGSYTPTFAVLGSTSARSLIHASDNAAGTVGSLTTASIFSGSSGNFGSIYAAINNYTINTGTNPTLATGAGYSYFNQGNGGYYNYLSLTGTGTNSKTFNGLANYFYFQTSGGALSLTGSLYGIRSSAQFVDTASSGITVTEIDDIILESPTFSSGITTITTRVGLNIAFNTTNVTNAWGIYQSNANVKNYFNGSVGLGTTSINASAILDISSTTKGFLPPRMTNANRTGITGVVGLIVYQTDGTEGLYLYKSTGWVLLL